MEYKNLLAFTQKISDCPYFNKADSGCKKSTKFKPVINSLCPTQKYLIISSDPSSDTNKTLGKNTPHSDFEVRFLALIFTDDDATENVKVIRSHFSDFRNLFNKYFYWTHYSKCHASGNPNSFCANQYLDKEIKLFKPALIISIGSKPVDHLLGREKLIERVNKILIYNGIPVISSLHPSRDWNLYRRSEYSFHKTWDLIRSTIEFRKEDEEKILKLTNLV